MACHVSPWSEENKWDKGNFYWLKNIRCAANRKGAQVVLFSANMNLEGHAEELGINEIVILIIINLMNDIKFCSSWGLLTNINLQWWWRLKFWEDLEVTVKGMKQWLLMKLLTREIRIMHIQGKQSVQFLHTNKNQNENGMECFVEDCTYLLWIATYHSHWRERHTIIVSCLPWCMIKKLCVPQIFYRES